MDFEALHKQLLFEKKSSALTPLPKTFYNECIEMLQFKKQGLKDSFSLELHSDYENCMKTFNDLVARRQQKIILKSLNDVQGGSISAEGLSDEEIELYEKLSSLLNLHSQKFREKIENAGRKHVRVLFLAEFDELIASDSKTYGPFEEGKEYKLPLQDSEKLLKKGVVKLV